VTVPPDARGQNFTILSKPISTTLVVSGTLSVATSLCYTDTQDLTTMLEFPRGAVTEATTIVLTPTLATGGADFAFAGHAFELEAYQADEPQLGMTFDEPVTVTIHYSEQDVRVISNESQLMLHWWDGSAWRGASETCDPPSVYARVQDNHVLSVPICHLSLFGLFGPTHQTYMPLVLRSSQLR
jgi:hypothetical protein